ncbi:MAG: NAD(P)H-dependent oxidoreductase [Candidatus Micrarchaeaceae archaeon]
MDKKIKILGIVGSLRKGSFNMALMHYAKSIPLKDAEIEIADISEIPIFNQDLESQVPESVKNFKQKIKQSNAILISTPEYNYSIPGVLKNAIDWASRPYGDNSFDNKIVGIMSGSGGYIGGARAQYHLRQIFVFLNMHPVNKPEVIVPMIHEKIDENGVLTDENTKKKIEELVKTLINHTKKLTE